MTRVYLAVSAADLGVLAGGGAISSAAFGVTPSLESAMEGDVEELEFAALGLASDVSLALDRGHRIVVAADVSEGAVVARTDVGRMDLRVDVAIEDVAAIHLGLDGDEDLAWYATQEVGEVLALLAGTVAGN